MKIGDRVICILDGFIAVETGLPSPYDPRKGQKFTILDIIAREGRIYLAFEELPLDIDEDYHYYPIECFRKLEPAREHTFTNEVTKELVKHIEEVGSPDRLLEPERVFTIEEEF